MLTASENIVDVCSDRSNHTRIDTRGVNVSVPTTAGTGSTYTGSHSPSTSPFTARLIAPYSFFTLNDAPSRGPAAGPIVPMMSSVQVCPRWCEMQGLGNW